MEVVWLRQELPQTAYFTSLRLGQFQQLTARHEINQARMPQKMHDKAIADICSYSRGPSLFHELFLEFGRRGERTLNLSYYHFISNIIPMCYHISAE